MTTSTATTNLPPGWYAIGDPCQVLPGAGEDGTLLPLLSSSRAVELNTGGDGWLVDQEGGRYAIDTGRLLVCPLQAADGQAVDRMVRRGHGTVREFCATFDVTGWEWPDVFRGFTAQIGPLRLGYLGRPVVANAIGQQLREAQP